jgi:hypothetical protein
MTRYPSSFNVLFGYLITGLSAKARSLRLGPQHRTRLATNQPIRILTHFSVKDGAIKINRHAKIVLIIEGAIATKNGLKKEF